MRSTTSWAWAAIAMLAGCSSSGGGVGGAADGAVDSTAPGVDTGTPAADSTPASDTGAAADTAPPADSGPITDYGTPYTGGQFNLGPVDWSESQFHNACAPGTKYDSRVSSAEGDYLAGIWNGIPNVAGYCDACIFVTTAKGKSALLRVVTYGDTTSNSIDVSPQAFALLDSGEYPRAMTWQFAKCNDTGAMMYEFQTGSSEWWTSLWVRNARVPLSKVEVKSVNHASWTALQRGGDGTLTDASGFGKGAFSIRSTGIDGQTVVQDFTWPAAGVAGLFVVGASNFD